MAAKTFYIINLVSTSPPRIDEGNWSGSAGSSSGLYGFAGTTAANQYALSRYDPSFVILSWGAGLQPDAQTGLNSVGGEALDCLRSTNAYTGTFAAGAWSFVIPLIRYDPTGNTYQADVRIRVWRSPNADGSSAVEIAPLPTTLAGSAPALNGSTYVNSTISWNAPQFALNSEYLFIQIGWKIRVAGGTAYTGPNSGSYASVGAGPATPAVTTTNFTADARTFYLDNVTNGVDSHPRAIEEQAPPDVPQSGSTNGGMFWNTPTSQTGYAQGVHNVSFINSALTASVLPDSTAPIGTHGDCYRLDGPITGTFSAAAWALNFQLTNSSATPGSVTCGVTVRVFRGTNASGSGATEITSGVLSSGLVTINSQYTQVAVPISWSPGALNLSGEYLFFKVALHVTVASSGGFGPVTAVGQKAFITTAPFVGDKTVGLTGLVATAQLGSFAAVVGVGVVPSAVAPAVASVGTPGIEVFYAQDTGNSAYGRNVPFIGIAPSNLVNVGVNGVSAAGALARVGAGTGVAAFESDAFQPYAFQEGTSSYVNVVGVYGTGVVNANFGVTAPSAVAGVAATGAVGIPAYSVTYYMDGGVASASSFHAYNHELTPRVFSPTALINNDRIGQSFNVGTSRWIGNQVWIPEGASTPDWAQVDFPGARNVDTVVVYSMQDNLGTTYDPDHPSGGDDEFPNGVGSPTFNNYGAVGFTVQTWNGSTWVTQATVTGNNLVKRSVTFPSVSTTAVRVNITSTHGFTPITGGGTVGLAEISVWGMNNGIYTNVALQARGGVWATAQYGVLGPDMNVFPDSRGDPYFIHIPGYYPPAMPGYTGLGAVGKVKVIGDVNYNVAGVRGVGVVGLVAPTSGYAVGGLFATGAVGANALQNFYPVRGVSASGLVGNVVAGEWKSVVAPTLSAVAIANAPMVVIPKTVFETGVAAGGNVGVVGIATDCVVSPGGLFATATLGNTDIRIHSAIAVMGLASIGQTGLTVEESAYALLGVQAVGRVGTASPSYMVDGVKGVRAFGQIGSVTIHNDYTIFPTGVHANGLVGVPEYPPILSLEERDRMIYTRAPQPG